MPLFKRRGTGDQSRRGDPISRILSESEILDRVEEEIFRADRYGRPLVVLCALPQRLGAGDALQPAEVASAAEVVGAQLRFSDRIGNLADGTIVAVLPETTVDVAQSIAYRIADELTRRKLGASPRKWSVGSSTFPDDGPDPPAIVTAAMRRAKSP